MTTLRPIRCLIALPQTGSIAAARAVFGSLSRDSQLDHRVVLRITARHGNLP